MSRTATSVLLSAWVAVTLLFAASCSKQPAGTVQQPAGTVQTVDSGVQQPEATAPVEPAMPTPEVIDEPLMVPEDPIADPADMVLEPADPVDPVDPVDPLDPVDPADPLDPTPSVADSLDDLFFGMDGQTEKDAEAEAAKRPDVIFVPTPQEVVDRMLELVQVTKDDVVYDLGCGDGRIVATAAKKYGCKAIGFDIDPQRIEDSLATVKEMGVEDLVEIRKQDIFTLDLTPASVITLYLLPELNVRLIPQLDKLKPGTRIVSHAFNMRGVKPLKVETIEGELGSQHTIYMWTTPLDKQGDDNGDDEF